MRPLPHQRQFRVQEVRVRQVGPVRPCLHPHPGPRAPASTLEGGRSWRIRSRHRLVCGHTGGTPDQGKLGAGAGAPAAFTRACGCSKSSTPPGRWCRPRLRIHAGLGVPPYIYRQLAIAVAGLIGSTLRGNGHRALYHENRVRYLSNYIAERWREEGQPSGAESGTLSASSVIASDVGPLLRPRCLSWELPRPVKLSRGSAESIIAIGLDVSGLGGMPSLPLTRLVPPGSAVPTVGVQRVDDESFFPLGRRSCIRCARTSARAFSFSPRACAIPASSRRQSRGNAAAAFHRAGSRAQR